MQLTVQHHYMSFGLVQGPNPSFKGLNDLLKTALL